jgi:hypothetical protein
MIGVPGVADQLAAVGDCMARHGVTWQRLRGDFEGSREYEITSFRKLHGSELDAFASEVSRLEHGFSLFYPSSGETPYDSLCRYLEARLIELRREIDGREAQRASTEWRLVKPQDNSGVGGEPPSVS